MVVSRQTPSYVLKSIPSRAKRRTDDQLERVAAFERAPEMLAAAEDLFVQVAHPRHAVDDGGSGQVARVEVAVELAPARARFRTHYELGNDELLSSWPGGRRFEPQMGNASFGRATASKKPQEPRSCHLWHEHTFPTWKGEARQEPRRA